jgi:hypothetical protein
MFEFRLRILEAGPDSYLGVVERFPQVMAHSTSPRRAEAHLTRALIDFFNRLQDRESTLIRLGDMPTVRSSRIYLCFRAS